MTDAEIAAAYDSRAAEYIEVAGGVDQMDAGDHDRIALWRDATPGLLLDAGCGSGIWTDVLHDGDREVVGVDISTEFLRAARERHPHLSFSSASFRALPFSDASIGGILAWYSLIHTPPGDVPLVLAEFARVVAPGGSVLVGFFDGPPRERFAHAIAPAYFWTAAALEPPLAGAGFTITQRERRDRRPGEVSKRSHGAVTAIRRA